MNEWQPIDTAPEEVKVCLLYCPDPLLKRNPGRGVIIGRVTYGTPYGNGMNGDWEFTHWQPLPEPPK